MKRLIFILVATILNSEFAEGQKLIGNSESVRFEKVDCISVKDLWSFARSEHVYSEIGAVLGYWEYDVEDAPRQGEWVAIGIVLAGFGDIGEKPVAAIVWTNGDVVFLDQLSRMASTAGNSAIMAFSVSDLNCSSGSVFECAKRLPHVSLNSKGEFMAGNSLIAIVE
jgi:hypothetical protein